MKKATTSTFTSLIALKSSVCVSSHNGRVLYEVKLSPVWRNRFMDMFGRMDNTTTDFEIVQKSYITGVVTDNGYILIDKRIQNELRKNKIAV